MEKMSMNVEGEGEVRRANSKDPFNAVEEPKRKRSCDLWLAVLATGLGTLLGALVAGLTAGFVTYNVSENSCSTTSPTFPPTVSWFQSTDGMCKENWVRSCDYSIEITGFPDPDCVMPWKGVAGSLQPLGKSETLLLSPCFNFYALGAPDLEAKSIEAIPLASNIKDVVSLDDNFEFQSYGLGRGPSGDTLKFTAIDGNMLYITTWYNATDELGTGNACHTLRLFQCDLGTLPVNNSTKIDCALLFDPLSSDPTPGVSCTCASTGRCEVYAVGGGILATDSEVSCNLRSTLTLN